MSVGVGLVIASQYLSNMPYSFYAHSDYWLNSPGLTATKLGVVLCLLAVSYLWANVGASQRWSLFRQLGTTSLLVYWVHVEIVYGRWFGFWKEGLTVQQVVLFCIVLTALMTLLSILRTRRKTLHSFFQSNAVPQRRAASGD
jgi:fucose 4-O-acetylase-like acetyltransferase